MRSPSRARGWIVALALGAGLAAGCRGGKEATDETPATPKEEDASSPTVIEPPHAPRFTDEVSVAHILIRYEGSAGSEGIHRTREEAQEIARRLYERAAAGEDFDALAVRYSEDEKTSARGGWLEPIPPPRQPDNRLAQAAHALAIGEVSEPVEDAEGFHVLRRGKLEYITVAHILITHAGSIHRPGTERTREQARQLATELHEKLLAGADFAALAREYSEDPSATHGGEMEPFPRGRMVAPFERAAFALAPGETSDVVETVYGFHILRRLR
jgi:parvulin-like peptidyl-prolyl isomerase